MCKFNLISLYVINPIYQAYVTIISYFVYYGSITFGIHISDILSDFFHELSIYLNSVRFPPTGPWALGEMGG